MRFKIDENLPLDAAESLRRAGHDATTVPQQGLGGEPDAHIASVCQTEGLALVTLDTDFGDIRAYPPSQYSGLIVLRLRTQDKPHVLDVLDRLLPLLASDPLTHHLWIVEEERVRIRS
jgi:predicted nuclease of predicted toxin-antitoxin system